MRANNLLLFTVLVALLQLATSDSIGNGADCSKQANGVRLVDPSSCTNFIICYNQRPVRRSCPRGLYFDDTTLNCNYAALVSCSRYNGAPGTINNNEVKTGDIAIEDVEMVTCTCATPIPTKCTCSTPIATTCAPPTTTVTPPPAPCTPTTVTCTPAPIPSPTPCNKDIPWRDRHGHNPYPYPPPPPPPYPYPPYPYPPYPYWQAPPCWTPCTTPCPVAETGNSGTGNSETGNSETGNSETGNSETGNSETGNSGTGNSGNSTVESYVLHETNPRKYYVIRNGNAVPMKCSITQIFDLETKTCRNKSFFKKK